MTHTHARQQPGRRTRATLGWALLAVAGTVAAAALAAPTAAAPDGRIVIHGAGSGSHLQLTVANEHVVVDGFLAPGAQAGCRVTRPRATAVCPIAGADSIEIEMGPSGDLVEVLDRLPFPLTIHLGAGEDKFIGNGERDTCYPEGTRRNRCVGGGGDDVCITGPRNSDCVGGPGNDYCRHGTGSDGCWGGPGRDVCYMGPGHDGCHGDGGNDRLFEGASSGKLYGGPGFDYCDGGPGVGRSQTCEAGPRR
jgi:hypothetical protein